MVNVTIRDTMLGNAPKSHGPMPTLRIPLVKVVPEEEVPVAHKEVGVVVDEEAVLEDVEDGRILAVVDKEALLEGMEDGRLLEEQVAVVVGREGLIEEGLLTSYLTQMVEIMGMVLVIWSCLFVFLAYIHVILLY